MSEKYATRSSWFNCSGKPGYTCPKLVFFKTTQISVNRNGVTETITIKQPTTPYWAIQSQNIKSSTYYTAGQSLTYANRPLNVFGYWAGAPAGSGSPPRNTFN